MFKWGGIIFFLALFSEKIYAIDQEPLYQSFRAEAMGGAYTAVVEDKDSIFYNPAGLAAVKKMSLNILDLNLEASQDTLSMAQGFLQTKTKSFNFNVVDSMIGRDLYLRSQVGSSVVFPHFGLAIMADEQALANIKNASMVQGIIGSQTTYGIQAGAGFRVVKLRRKKGEIRVGFAPKILWRSGGFKEFSLTDLLTMNTTPYKGFANHYGMGLGLDLGTQYVVAIKKKFFLSTGISWKDIGDTTFSSGANPQLSNLSLGVAGSFRSRDAMVTLAYDYSNVLDSLDWKKKNHLGLELKFPFLRLYGGLNQFSISYGGGFSLGILELMFLSYAREQGYYVGQDSSRRYMLKIGLKFEL